MSPLGEFLSGVINAKLIGLALVVMVMDLYVCDYFGFGYTYSSSFLTGLWNAFIYNIYTSKI
jgi:hypothetical protein